MGQIQGQAHHHSHAVRDGNVGSGTGGTAAANAMYKPDKATIETSRRLMSEFSKSEVKYLKATFKDLAMRSPGPTIDRKTFLQHFSLPGLHGEQLFNVFDFKKTGVLDFTEFLTGLALCLRGTLDEKLDMIFRIYDITHDGCVSKEELETMLHHVPFNALSILINANHNNPMLNSPKSSTKKILEVEPEVKGNFEMTAGVKNPKNDDGLSQIQNKDNLSKDSLHSLQSIASVNSDTSNGSGSGAVSDGSASGNINEKLYGLSAGISRQEMIDGLLQEAYDKFDSDGDGKLTKDEFRNWVTSTPEVMGFLDSVFTFMCTKTVPILQAKHVTIPGSSSGHNLQAPNSPSRQNSLASNFSVGSLGTSLFIPPTKTNTTNTVNTLASGTDSVNFPVGSASSGNTAFEIPGSYASAAMLQKAFLYKDRDAKNHINNSTTNSFSSVEDIDGDGFIGPKKSFSISSATSKFRSLFNRLSRKETSDSESGPQAEAEKSNHSSDSKDDGRSHRSSHKTKSTKSLKAQAHRVDSERCRARSHSPTHFFDVNNDNIDVNNLTINSASSLAKFNELMQPIVHGNTKAQNNRNNLLGLERTEPVDIFLNETNVERTKSVRSMMNSSPLSFSQTNNGSKSFVNLSTMNQQPLMTSQSTTGLDHMNNFVLQRQLSCSQVYKEGRLSKVGKKSSLRISRHYVLRGNVMCYFNNKRDRVPRGVILLSGSFIDPIKEEEASSMLSPRMNNRYGFQIENTFHDSIRNYPDEEEDEIKGENKVLRRVFYAQTRAERDDWVQKLREASKDRKFESIYTFNEEIGSGKFATVHKCTNKETGEKFAVKVLKKQNMSLREKELLRTEIAILRLVDHENVVKFIDVFETVDNIYIVTELVTGGELFEAIVGRSRFNEDEAYVLMKQLIEAIDYLHCAGIVHRDIKPENVLLENVQADRKLGKETRIKLTDFGLSKLVFPNEKMDLPCGTVSYVAPEVLKQSGYGIEADLWSIGIIMFLVLRGKLPFEADDSEEIKSQILGYTDDLNKSMFADAVWSKIDNGLVKIVSGLLQSDPKKRLTTEQVLQSPWMQQMERKLPLAIYAKLPHSASAVSIGGLSTS